MVAGVAAALSWYEYTYCFSAHSHSPRSNSSSRLTTTVLNTAATLSLLWLPRALLLNYQIPAQGILAHVASSRGRSCFCLCFHECRQVPSPLPSKTEICSGHHPHRRSLHCRSVQCTCCRPWFACFGFHVLFCLAAGSQSKKLPLTLKLQLPF